MKSAHATIIPMEIASSKRIAGIDMKTGKQGCVIMVIIVETLTMFLVVHTFIRKIRFFGKSRRI